jgi:malate/lactate dehydrogenase
MAFIHDVVAVAATSPIRRKFAGDSAMFAIATVLAAALVDLSRSRRSLLTEIALLRHQLTVLERSVARPHVMRLDRSAGGARCHHTDVEERAAGGPTRDASSLAPRRLQGSLALAQSARADVAHRL